MRLPRERVSIAEVQATDSAILDKLFEFYDFSAGEYFFIKDQPDKAYVIEAEERDNNLNVVYDGGKVIDYYDNCLPLISTTAIIDMIGYYGESFELRAWGKGWLLITDEIIESAEGEDLVGFLWKTLTTLLVKP
ncbi:hypothetical protein [Paenibacillus sp. FSL F4-0097]|uniref:hypothetical protein n=1 Tax=Paenibacillus sp. FSL F4-0097 TaxID=2921369 RepID=UPI003158B49C